MTPEKSLNYSSKKFEIIGIYYLYVGRLIRRLPNKEPGILSSYELSRPLSDISLLDVLEATNEPIRCNMPTPEEFYIYHRQIANKIGVFNQVARTFLADIKIADW